jgi:NADH-quinone oxidoreductase subunit I
MGVGDEMKDQLSFLGGFKLTFQHLTRPRVTTQYPEEKKAKQPRQHGRHVLNRYEDGMEKCIGCELCAGVCPADCIYVRGLDNPPDHPVSPGERYGFVYEINFLRCIHCDMCVEACPTEAITESKLFEFSFTNQSDAIYTKNELLVDDQGMPQKLPWEDWREGDDMMTSGWMRATSPSGSAAYEGEVQWSGELGYGVRTPEGGQSGRRNDELTEAAARHPRAPPAGRGHPTCPPRHAGKGVAGQGRSRTQPQEDGSDTRSGKGVARRPQGSQGEKGSQRHRGGRCT